MNKIYIHLKSLLIYVNEFFFDKWITLNDKFDKETHDNLLVHSGINNTYVVRNSYVA